MHFKPLVKELFLCLLAAITISAILNVVTGDSELIDIGSILNCFGVVGSIFVLVHLKEEPKAEHGWFMAAPFAFIFMFLAIIIDRGSIHIVVAFCIALSAAAMMGVLAPESARRQRERKRRKIAPN